MKMGADSAKWHCWSLACREGLSHCLSPSQPPHVGQARPLTPPPSPTSGDTTQGAPQDPTRPDASTTEASSAVAGSCGITSPATGTYALIDQTESAGIVDPLTGMHGHAAAWGDADGNGFPDLYVGTFADRADEIYAVRGATGPSPDRLLFGSGTAFVETSPLAVPPGRTSGAVSR